MKRMQCVQDDEERKINRKTANFAANKVRGFSPCLNEEPYMEVEQGVQTCRLQFRTSILHSWLPFLFSWLPPFNTSSIAKYLKAVSRNLNKFLLLPTILELPLAEIVATEMRSAKGLNGERLISVYEFLTTQQVASFFSRMVWKVKQKTALYAQAVSEQNLVAMEEELNLRSNAHSMCHSWSITEQTHGITESQQLSVPKCDWIRLSH